MEPQPQPLSEPEPEPQHTEHSQTPQPGNLRRVVPPSPHIEGRAVTHHFLRRLTDARITPELKRQCTESSQAWYAQQIERTRREMEADEVGDGSGGSTSVPQERKLTAQRLKQRLEQLTRDLEKRERATRPLAWYEERTAEAEQEKRTQDEQHVERIQRGVRRDMTPFLRVGFQQADELLQPGKTPFLYCGAFSWLINPLTHEAGSAPGLVTPPLPFPFQDW